MEEKVYRSVDSKEKMERTIMTVMNKKMQGNKTCRFCQKDNHASSECKKNVNQDHVEDATKNIIHHFAHSRHLVCAASHKKESWNKLVENFETMEKSDIIEEVNSDPDQGYYIPYQQVNNLGSNTTKVRTVFDASSKKRGEISLNEALHQGPSLIPMVNAVFILNLKKN